MIAHEWDEFRETQASSAWNRCLLTEAVVLYVAVFFLDAATLGVLLGAAESPSVPTVVFASLVTATAVASVGLVPGGSGTFEGTCVVRLHAHGVELEAALAATILLRGLTFWLPMLPGVLSVRCEFLRCLTMFVGVTTWSAVMHRRFCLRRSRFLPPESNQKTLRYRRIEGIESGNELPHSKFASTRGTSYPSAANRRFLE